MILFLIMIIISLGMLAVLFSAAFHIISIEPIVALLCILEIQLIFLFSKNEADMKSIPVEFTVGMYSVCVVGFLNYLLYIIHIHEGTRISTINIINVVLACVCQIMCTISFNNFITRNRK